MKCKGPTGCRSVPAYPPGKRKTLISSGQRLKVHLHLPRKKQSVSITNTDWLMLLRDINGSWCENDKQTQNTLCG